MADGDDWLVSRPIAHRGLYDVAAGRPENSLPAFRQAVESGVPFEFDVQLAGDGTAVVVHDKVIPDGAGGVVAATELTEAHRRRLDIPVLAEVLGVVNGRVPIVVDVRRWRLGLNSGLEHVVARELRGYTGPLVIQSFDPLAVYRLRRLVPDRRVGQISGQLHSRGPVLSAIGRTMLTNFVTRPDFVTYELSALPSRYVSYWRARGAPVVTFSVRSAKDEARARAVADNFFFAGYLPAIYDQADLRKS